MHRGVNCGEGERTVNGSTGWVAFRCELMHVGDHQPICADRMYFEPRLPSGVVKGHQDSYDEHTHGT